MIILQDKKTKKNSDCSFVGIFDLRPKIHYMLFRLFLLNFYLLVVYIGSVPSPQCKQESRGFVKYVGLDVVCNYASWKILL